ncbi:NlpC/P60 family protein [Actinomycetospora succinea]|uniref:NlpC/P60 family protein n=1 Tax=Actinomycetospora succinea TaxID=663603 RepID=A0A4R6UUG5_9PSEU|nr:NlpC/P60 family protein [Actinomycetospora succinea]TDQ50950.1 NlpC/P60 family protein [Actinomycetospora succinea]
MTAALPRRSPQQMTAVLGIAVGAVGAAVLGSHAGDTGDLALPDTGSTTAELNLASHHTPSASVAPVHGEVTSAAATVPELTKAAQRQQAAAAHSRKIEDAIDRFESRIGTTRYEGYCERAVENAFGTQGHYGSARQDWRSQDQHSDWQNAPRGAMVFYNTSANAHVALSLGDGRVVSSSAHGKVGIVPIDHFQHPLGWAYAPY